MRTPWTGVGTALVTPFTGAASWTKRRCAASGGGRSTPAFIFWCLRHHRRNPTLSLAERLRMVEILVDEAAGKVPVLAGAGGYNTKEVIHLAHEMAKAGAQGLLSVTPDYNKPTQTASSSITARSRRARRCRSSSTTCPSHRCQRGRADSGPHGRDAEHRRREGGFGQRHADVRDLPGGACRFPPCCRGRS